MKSTPTVIFIAVSLSLAAAAAQGAANTVSGASTVAGMLQRKHDAELRAEFVRDGRADDVRRLDAVIAQRAETQRGHAHERMNEQLARANGRDGALECIPGVAHAR